ncbi:hypothetical protein SynBIOSE41_04343 [Synechococcus sp. BIOS-E4-1]|nr:hypothetical protein SynBIOSE41_04343 [Synechococcus sp. BIOS-E4-1]
MEKLEPDNQDTQPGSRRLFLLVCRPYWAGVRQRRAFD